MAYEYGDPVRQGVALRVLVAAMPYETETSERHDDNPVVLGLLPVEEMELWTGPGAECLFPCVIKVKGFHVWEGTVDTEWVGRDGIGECPVNAVGRIRLATPEDLGEFGFTIIMDALPLQEDGSCAYCGGFHGPECPNAS